MSMRIWGLMALSGLIAACSPAGSDQDPRDRKGQEGALTWRAVAQADGQAAFLSRPGAAPDLVLWCNDSGLLTLRAHVFENPQATPDLKLQTDGGLIAFANVRRQGGVRETDRKLVEGNVALSDGKLPDILRGAANLTVTSGSADFTAKDTDPSNILPAFTQACASQLQTQKATK
jgi:hypothetical protein